MIVRKGRGEKTREKTSAGHSLAALDQFSAADDDDLERDAHLLGEPCLFGKGWWL